MKVVDLDHKDITEGVLLDQVVNGLEQGVPGEHKTNHGLHAGLIDSGLLLTYFIHAQRYGFFDDDVFARFRCGDDWGGVHATGGTNRDHIDIVTCN